MKLLKLKVFSLCKYKALEIRGLSRNYFTFSEAFVSILMLVFFIGYLTGTRFDPPHPLKEEETWQVRLMHIFV